MYFDPDGSGPSAIYAKVVKVRTIELIKQFIVFSTLIDTKKTLSLDSIVAGAGVFFYCGPRNSNFEFGG